MPSKSQPAGYSREAWEKVIGSMPDIDREQHPVLAALYAEHRYIGTLLKMLSQQLEHLEQGEEVDAHILYEVMHYMTHYPDAFHHPREDLVYQRAGELDPQISDSVDTLQREHDHLATLGSDVLDAIAAWRDGRQKTAAVLDAGWEYLGAMYRHMSAEEKLVFPQIHELLSEEDWLELEEEDLLRPVSDPVFGPKVAREYSKLARRARRAIRHGAEDAAVAEWIGLEGLLEAFEVLSLALDNGREAAREHLNAALDDTREMIDDVREGEGSALLLPLRATVNGAGRYVDFLKELRGISRDTLSDFRDLGRGVRSRMDTVFGEEDSPGDKKPLTTKAVVKKPARKKPAAKKAAVKKSAAKKAPARKPAAKKAAPKASKKRTVH